MNSPTSSSRIRTVSAPPPPVPPLVSPKDRHQAQQRHIDQFVLEDSICVVCRNPRDEEKTLLCDGCEISVHIDCLDPPLARVPDVPLWFCPQCVNDQLSAVCAVCRRDDNEERMLLCDACLCGYHMFCLTPVLDIIPEGEWFCAACSKLPVAGSGTPRIDRSILPATDDAGKKRKAADQDQDASKRNSLICKICGKVSLQIGDHHKHARVHTGERPFHCRIESCSHTFSDSSTRTRHERRPHDVPLRLPRAQLEVPTTSHDSRPSHYAPPRVSPPLVSYRQPFVGDHPAPPIPPISLTLTPAEAPNLLPHSFLPAAVAVGQPAPSGTPPRRPAPHSTAQTRGLQQERANTDKSADRLPSSSSRRANPTPASQLPPAAAVTSGAATLPATPSDGAASTEAAMLANSLSPISAQTGSTTAGGAVAVAVEASPLGGHTAPKQRKRPAPSRVAPPGQKCSGSSPPAQKGPAPPVPAPTAQDAPPGDNPNPLACSGSDADLVDDKKPQPPKPVCTVQDCSRIVHAKGLCRAHAYPCGFVSPEGVPCPSGAQGGKNKFCQRHFTLFLDVATPVDP